MPELKVKVENLPTRCDVCHQSDLFDPESNHCARCKDTTALIARSLQLLRPKKEPPPNAQPSYTFIDLRRSQIETQKSLLILHSILFLFQVHGLFIRAISISRIACIVLFSLLLYSAASKLYHLKKDKTESGYDFNLYLKDNWINLVVSICIATISADMIGDLIFNQFSYYSLIMSLIGFFCAYPSWKLWRNNRKVAQSKTNQEV